jgi:hypothetical protein
MERISLDEGGVNLVVIRHGQHIEIHSLSAGVFTLLDALAKNSAFAQACQLAIARDPECDMAAALHFLVAQKIVTGYSLPSTAQNSLSHPFA